MKFYFLTILVAPVGYRVVAWFVNGYSLQEDRTGNSTVCRDYLTFQDGLYDFSPVIKMVCGKKKKDEAQEITTTSRFLRVVLHTDHNVTENGFKMEYEFRSKLQSRRTFSIAFI